MLRRHEFRQKCVDGDLLEAHADSRNEAPQVDHLRGGLKRHDRRRQRIPGERDCENRASPEPVRDEAEPNAAHPHSSEGAEDEKAYAARIEESRWCGREEPAPNEAGCDVRRHEEVVQLEDATECDQQHESPQRARERQPVEPRCDVGCMTARNRRIHNGVNRRPLALLATPDRCAPGEADAREDSNQYTARPPEMSKTAPVVNEHSSDDSQAISAAISSGSTKRPIGIFDNM